MGTCMDMGAYIHANAGVYNNKLKTGMRFIIIPAGIKLSLSCTECDLYCLFVIN